MPPAGATNTWNDGPDTGAGVHWNAQPMFHGAAVTEKVGLVQFPLNWVAGKSNCKGVPGAVVGVDAAAVVVVTADAGAVVGTLFAAVEPPPWCDAAFPGPLAGAVVVGAEAPEAAGGGSAASCVLPPVLTPDPLS